MCTCTSPWATNASNFITTQPHDALWHTVNFLVNGNHCGRANGVFLDDILVYLAANGFPLGREPFQHHVLIPLKSQGILVSMAYPGSIGGILYPAMIMM